MTREEFDIRKRELEILSREKEIEAKKIEIEKLEKQSWNRRQVLTPVSATIIVAMLGLLGTFITDYLQKQSAIAIEQQKFQFQIYSKAQQADNQQQAAHILDFYIRAGLIPGEEGQFTKLIEGGEFDKVPLFNGTESTFKDLYGDVQIPDAKSK